MMRPRLLRDFGWQVAVVLAKDWYADRDGVLRRILERLQGTLEPAAEEEPEADESPDEEA